MIELDSQLHKGGFYSIVKRFERNQHSFRNTACILPPADVDLNELWNITVQSPDAPEVADIDEWQFDVRRKHQQLQHSLVGENELFLLHAMLISILRRNDPPQEAADLFFRVWKEQGKALARALPTRWLISAATTFADCGQTMEQRSAGMGLYMLFDLVKLHDSERRVTGQKGDRPFRQTPGTTRQPLAFDMRPYSLARGDLDRNMLARLWKLCESDDTLGALGTHMLQMVMSDQRSIFARVQHYRSKKVKPSGESDV